MVRCAFSRWKASNLSLCALAREAAANPSSPEVSGVLLNIGVPLPDREADIVALCVAIFSTPRSSFRARIMPFTWSRDNIGESQKEQGCNPSRAHMIFPQLRQFGAVVNSGCIDALQSHFLRSEDNLGLVESSKAAIADVRSAMLDVVVVTASCLFPDGVDLPDCV